MPEERVSPELRLMVSERAGGCCEYCRAQQLFVPDPFAVEHVVGGETVPDNLALSCQGCNGHKHIKTESEDPLSGDIVRLFHPRRDRWVNHFGWTDNFALIVELTPTGRATVEALRLNREGLVNLRRLLAAAGRPPPIVD